jgi:hypothetical protein
VCLLNSITFGKSSCCLRLMHSQRRALNNTLSVDPKGVFTKQYNLWEKFLLPDINTHSEKCLNNTLSLSVGPKGVFTKPLGKVLMSEVNIHTQRSV